MSRVAYQQDRYSYNQDPSPSSADSYDKPTRKNTRRDQSARSSEGTVSTMMSGNTQSTGRESAGTNVTEGPAYSKKIVKYVPTVFENYITYPIHKKSGKAVELALWDTAGQEEYDRLRPLSYPETDLLFVCFAIDCPNSLENVMDKWYPEVLHFCPYTPLVLVGLKSDLRTKRTCIDLLKTQGLTPVTQEQGAAVAQKMGARYMECSSKEMRGVDEIFEQAIEIVVSGDRRNAAQTPQGGGATAGMVVKKKKRNCRFL
ncbi:RHO4 protein [Pseudogymnoascus australis]